MEEQKAIARFNMHFDTGNFKKNDSYNYIYKKDCVEIKTIEQKPQIFSFSEFETLFFFEKNKKI